MAETEVSGAARNDVWGLMLDLERHTRYYGRLADRCLRRYRTIRLFLLLGVLCELAVVYFFSGNALLLWTLGGTGALALGSVTMFDAATNYAETAAALRTASTLCDDLKTEGEQLWRDTQSHRISDDNAEERYDSIMDRWSRVTRGLTLAVHDRENARAVREAREVVSNRYAQQGHGLSRETGS